MPGSPFAELLKTSSGGLCCDVYIWNMCSVSRTLSNPCFLPFRYKIIYKEKTPAAGDDKKRSTDLLTKYDKTKKEWQLGKTKVRSGSQ